MTDLKYDKVIRIDIGYDDSADAEYVGITNVVSFAERVVSPDGDLVDPLAMINAPNPGGVHQNHKYWEMELVLDTNWYQDEGDKDQYWAYYQNVDGAGGVAIVENGPNNNIKLFIVHVREHDGTITKITYADTDANVLWCTGETSEFNNETGERNQTVTFKFICLQERETAAGAAAVAHGTEGAGRVRRINNVRTGGTDSVNILRFTEDFVMKMTPQFVPNTYQGVGVKQDEKYRVITVVVDSETDIFDYMLEITDANDPALTDFLVDFTMDLPTGITETWTYTPVGAEPLGSIYLSNRREGDIGDTSERSTLEYEFLSYGQKSVSQV